MIASHVFARVVVGVGAVAVAAVAIVASVLLKAFVLLLLSSSLIV